MVSSRSGRRWSDLHRHLSFGEGHDWHDIRELDWDSVRPDVEAAGRADADPLPVPGIDLGVAAAGQLTGTATGALPWDRLSDGGFERLLYDLLRDLPASRTCNGCSGLERQIEDVTCPASASPRTAPAASEPSG